MQDRLKKSFKVFLAHLWRQLRLPPPTPVQRDIADFLQAGPKRRVIEAFRGVGKSWITAAYVLWRLFRNPQLKILVVSASKDRADAFSVFVKQLIETVDILQSLKPQGNQRNSNLAFDVGPARPSQSPSVKSVGIFGQLTGSRADIIIADDVETPKTAYTQTMRDRLWEAVKEFDAVLTSNTGEENSIIYLGTPQTELSLYNELGNRGYSIRIWPARFPSAELAQFYGGKLAPVIYEWSHEAQVGDPVDPDRFDDADLIQRELSYGKTGFALQFMLDTRMSDELKYPLKFRDMIVFNVGLEKGPWIIQYGSGPEQLIPHQILPMVGLPSDRWYRPLFTSKGDEWREYQGAVMAIDPSGRGTDQTGYSIVKMLHGNLWVPDAGGLAGGYDRPTLETLARKAKIHKVNKIIIESNFGDGMFNELFKPVLRSIYPCSTEEIRNTIQKERRIIDVLEPIMNQHRLIVDEELIRRDAALCADDNKEHSLFWQMARLTKERGALAHDDALDALAEGVAYWVDKMGKEQQEAADQYRTEMLERELKSFHRHVMGYGDPESKTWFKLPLDN